MELQRPSETKEWKDISRPVCVSANLETVLESLDKMMIESVNN